MWVTIAEEDRLEVGALKLEESAADLEIHLVNKDVGIKQLDLQGGGAEGGTLKVSLSTVTY